MTPLPDSPKIVIQLANGGEVIAIASNIAQQVDVQIRDNTPDFQQAAEGMPFYSDNYEPNANNSESK